MPDLPTIKAFAPTVIPPVEEKVFDQYRLMELHIDAKDLGRPVDCVVRLQKGRVIDKDGNWELSTEPSFFLRFENLLHSAGADPDGLGRVIFGLLQYVSAEVARQQTPPPAVEPIIEPVVKPDPGVTP